MAVSSFDLTGKVAIVTGGGKGIGKAIALGFAESGADVVVGARTVADIEDTAAKVRALGRKALAVRTDIGSVDQVKNLLQKTLDSFGKVDILVNNAATSTSKERGMGYVLETSIDGWRGAIEGVLTSTFYSCKMVGEVMVKQRSGCIINISSGMGLGAFPGGAAGGVAKAGVIILTKTLALEWAPFNVRVNCISPGYVATDMLPARDWRRHPENIEPLLPNVAMGRVAEPEEMATVAIFLASPAASYVTGENIFASGGMVSTVWPNFKDYLQEHRKK